MENPLKYFAELRDPRVERTRCHLLQDIVLIAIAAILSGASGWDEIERYGKAKQSWLKSFTLLPHGMPSHDTFNRVFQALDPVELEDSFLGWVRATAGLTAGEVVAIDGKSLRGMAGADGKSIVPMVSAWASANNLVLAQRKTDAKSNEITAIPQLLAALELSGTVVTIDAIGCQKAIAQQIVTQEADYNLAVKERVASWVILAMMLAVLCSVFYAFARYGHVEELWITVAVLIARGRYYCDFRAHR